MTNRKLHNSCTGCACDFGPTCGMGYAKKPVQQGSRVVHVPANSCEKPANTFEVLELTTYKERKPDNDEAAETE